MPSRHRRRASARIARQAAELALATPQVMAHRLARLALAGTSPSARDRREFDRMVAEKLAAFYESWHAMSWALLRANLTWALAPLRFLGASRRGWRTGSTILGAGLAPVHRRATANARRLNRTRLSPRSK